MKRPPGFKSSASPLEAEKPHDLSGRRVLVVGLGRFGGGAGAVRWLAGQGASVTVTDRADRETLAESVDALADLDVTFHFGGHDFATLAGVEIVVVNPAVDKRNSGLFQEIVRQGIAWTTEINLFAGRCPCPVIGVTGTYGKSTTCAMLAAGLRACGSAFGAESGTVHVGGNFGGSLLAELGDIGESDTVVLELSSAQLEDLPRIDWAPRVAVITNLYPHHLDRYGTFAGYVEAKLNILGRHTPPEFVVAGELDCRTEELLVRRFAGETDRLIRVESCGEALDLSIPGQHNEANAACVLTVCNRLGLDGNVVREALRSFQGLPHRLQRVRTLDGVTYYNDSKATSPSATVRAVETLSGPIVAIVGGQAKAVPLDEFAELLVRRCSMVICIGESATTFADAVSAAAGEQSPKTVRKAGDLAEAVAVARREASAGQAVLYSPGAPSFDAYVNFAARGRHFIEIVSGLS